MYQYLLIVIIDEVLSNFTYPHRARMRCNGQVASDLKIRPALDIEKPSIEPDLKLTQHLCVYRVMTYLY